MAAVPEPTDADIEVRLTAAPASAWAELRDALAAVEVEDVLYTWSGGETLADGSITVPYPDYHPAVDRIHTAVGAVGALVVFGWMDWPGLVRYSDDPTAIASAPVADAARLLTAIFRSERFGDGNIAAALDKGILQAAVASIVKANTL